MFSISGHVDGFDYPHGSTTVTVTGDSQYTKSATTSNFAGRYLILNLFADGNPYTVGLSAGGNTYSTVLTAPSSGSSDVVQDFDFNN